MLKDFLYDCWPIVLIVVLVLAVAALLVVSLDRKNQEFKELCTARGGTTVYDGRQYQCWNP